MSKIIYQTSPGNRFVVVNVCSKDSRRGFIVVPRCNLRRKGHSIVTDASLRTHSRRRPTVVLDVLSNDQLVDDGPDRPSW